MFKPTRAAALAATGLALLAPTAVAGTDLRLPDTRDAAARSAAQGTDLRTPDTRDAAAGRDIPVPSTATAIGGAPTAVDSGFDWGDAGIGAAGMMSLVLAAVGGRVLTTHRRREQRLPIAAG